MEALASGRRSRGRLSGGRGLRLGVLLGIVALAFAFSQTCQRDQIRLTKEQAIATAESRVDFDPTRTQIRLLRQGLNSKPYWIVSLSIPGRAEGSFQALAVVTVDANSGKVTKLEQQRTGR